MLEKVKLALRINHNYLDEEITDTIAQARAEMVRAGVSETVASSSNVLVEGAIKTYCQYKLASDAKMTDGYFTSWEYQLDHIRKSSLEV